MQSSKSSLSPSSDPRRVAVPYRFGAMVSGSSHMKEIFDLAAALATSRASILIEGERGTGKQLLAREIHRRSPVARGPFVVARLEASGGRAWSERVERALFEAAEGGTLYLEELARVPPGRLVERLGALDRECPDVCADARSIAARRPAARIVVATRVDLEGRRGDGHFRELLSRRFALFPLRLPPLAARPEDIGLLADYCLARIAWRARREPLRLSDAARAQLCTRAFRGNVRELELILLRASRAARGPEIGPEDLPVEQQGRARPLRGARATRPAPCGGSQRAPIAARDEQRASSADGLEVGGELLGAR